MQFIRALIRRWARSLSGLLVVASIWPALLPMLASGSAQAQVSSLAGGSTLHAVLATSPEANIHAVCTAQGLKWVDDLGREVGRAGLLPDTPASLLDHCPMCLFGQAGGVPAPEQPVLKAPPPGVDCPPTAWLQAPRTPAVWRHAQSRAPPSQG